MAKANLSRHTVALYLEVDAAGVSERDAGQRALAALAELFAAHGARSRMRYNGELIEGELGQVLPVRMELLGDAFTQQLVVVRRA